jgi:hypothetical protein
MPKKAAKNPAQETVDALHTMPCDTCIEHPAPPRHPTPPGHPALPTIAFKAAVVSAARQISGITMTQLRGTFHTLGDLARVDGEWYQREDMVRLNGTTADLRYRPAFPNWSCDIDVRLNEPTLSVAQLWHLANQAGFSVGLLEWRTERDGPYGQFHVQHVWAIDPRTREVLQPLSI